MNHHAKSVLALPYGQAKVSTSSKHSFSSTREAILDAPLRKISVCFGKNSSGTGDCSEENSSRKTYRDGGNGKFICGQASPILDADHCMHLGYPQQPSLVWDSKTCREPPSRGNQGEERVEASMDTEGDRGGAIPDML